MTGPTTPRSRMRIDLTVHLLAAGHLDEDGAEIESVIEYLETLAAHPDTVDSARRQDLIHACALTIAALTQP